MREGLTRRAFLRDAALAGAASVIAACSGGPDARGTPWPSTPAPAVGAAKLPRWRGFNLLEKYTLAANKPFLESDFDAIKGWGFDFVRLPTDYRIWTDPAGGWRDAPLRELDEAVTFGRARGIHVDLCLHRAPGYCVNPPSEPLDLWGEGPGAEEALRQFTAQWRMFAKRYRGIPSAELSFNLVNEPPGSLADERYAKVASAAVQAIRDEDPDRLVIADGARYAQRPVPALAPLGIAQSLHGYAPTPLTHYKASWIQGSDAFPVPSWPIRAAVDRYLFGDSKRDLASPLLIEGSFAKGARVTITVESVSTRADLAVRADAATVLEHPFVPGPGAGEWRTSTLRPQFGSYQAEYGRAYAATLPADARTLRIELSKGDWLTFSEIRVAPYAGAPGAELVIRPGDGTYGIRQQRYVVDGGVLARADGTNAVDKDTLWRDQIEPFQALAAQGVGVHLGEWGVYAKTPHAVALAWMADVLRNWQRAGWGWSLWNLRGAFGPLESGRADVAYEDFHGLKLDRGMLDLLRTG